MVSAGKLARYEMNTWMNKRRQATKEIRLSRESVILYVKQKFLPGVSLITLQHVKDREAKHEGPASVPTRP